MDQVQFQKPLFPQTNQEPVNQENQEPVNQIVDVDFGFDMCHGCCRY